MAWHTNFDYIIATGSADSKIRVWDTKNKGHKKLSMHSGIVRSLSWNNELPWLLISGGDDSLFGVWDIRSNELVMDVYEPCVSITSI